MAVQFILGRSGTGKTSYCIKAIVDALLEPADPPEAGPLILLVPEQATYQAERAILADKRVAGYSRLNVLSFDRLQFLLLGKNTARPALSRIGQQMIVHRILRDNKSKLKVFDSSADRPGLGRQMAETIVELHQYAKTPEDVERLLGELQKDEHNSLTALKFADIGLIFNEYLEFIEGKFFDPDVQLKRIFRAVREANLAKGAKLWIDGFASFTTSELAILAELLKVAAEAQIALCLDPSSIDLANPDTRQLNPVSIFGPTEQTYAALIEVTKKSKLRLAEPIILKRAVRFSRCPPLAHIEKNIFKEPHCLKSEIRNPKSETEGEIRELQTPNVSAADNIRIISAPNARAEVQFVARQILRLVKEKGYRYRDIAVIASDIGRYEHYIRAYFDNYGIAFFIDKRTPLNQHPAIQLICSALQVVTGGFFHSDIFAYLKTDLVPLERYDVDLLENYCLAFGISGDDWQGDKDWHFAGEDNEDFDEQRINEIRQKVSQPLLWLRDRLLISGNSTKMVSAEAFVRLVFDFMEMLHVHETIAGWIEEAVASGDYVHQGRGEEHRQFYDKLINIFDELVEVFGGQAMSCEDYLAIINSAFSQLTLAFIPPTLDQVLVGSIERSRHPDLKAVFLIGATQKQFPVPVGLSGILTDDDRGAAKSADFPLAATVSQRLVERQYLAYIAFTRPSEFLYVTYPAVDDKGSAVPRSQLMDDIESLFEDVCEESISSEQIEIDNVHSESELTDLLCSQLGKDMFRGSLKTTDERYIGLLDDIRADEELAELGSNVFYAINYDNRAWLDRDVVEKLFGQQIRSSATRLSSFAACPYQYFARYILQLEQRKEFKFEPLDVGRFYHRVLDALLKRLNAEKKDFRTIQDEELLRFLRDEISKLVQADSFISHFSRRSRHNAYIIDSAGETLEDCVLAIAQIVRAGKFRPIRAEVSFGEVKDAYERLGEYRLGLSAHRKLFLDGKIDRLDVANIDGEEVAIIFDYKRRAKYFSWSELYYGLDMQLPIYMLAVLSAKNSTTKEAIGAFYIPVEMSPTQSTLDTLSGKTDSFNYKAKGIFNGGFFQQLDNTVSSGWSKFYSFRITSKDQQYGDYGRSAALRSDDFEKILKFTETKIVRLAEEILSGKIDVKPYRLNQKSPCSFCKYKSVCQFDWQINDYNFLESLNKLQALEKMGAIDG